MSLFWDLLLFSYCRAKTNIRVKKRRGSKWPNIRLISQILATKLIQKTYVIQVRGQTKSYNIVPYSTALILPKLNNSIQTKYFSLESYEGKFHGKFFSCLLEFIRISMPFKQIGPTFIIYLFLVKGWFWGGWQY